MTFRVLLCSICILASACHPWDQDQRDPDQTLKVKPQLCLEKWPDHVNSFLMDQADSAEVNEIINCLQNSLNLFVSLTLNGNSDQYSSEKLRLFFNRYLLKENQIQTSFMAQLMKMKVLLLGGGEQSLTLEEIRDLVEYLEIFRQQAQALRGRIGYILFRGTGGQSHEETQLLFKNAFSELLKRSQAPYSNYEFADLKDFFRELDFFLNMPSSTEVVRKWLPLVEAAKDLLMADAPFRASTRAWLDTSDWLIDAYFFVLKYYYQIQYNDLATVSDWKNLLSWLDQGMKLLQTAPQWQRRSYLPVEDIDHVVDELWNLNVFQTDLTAEIIKDVYRKVFAYMLDYDPQRKKELFAIKGMEWSQLRILIFEYHAWKVSQLSILNLSEAAHSNSHISQSHFRKLLNEFNVAQAISNLEVDSELAKSLMTSWRDWVDIFNGTSIPLWTRQGHFLMTYDSKDQLLNLEGLSFVNILRSVARLIYRGYGDFKNNSIFQSHLNVKQLSYLEEDFSAAGLALGILDPRQGNSAVKTFLETNLFTPSGDGNDDISGLEMMEEMQMTVSGGRHMALQAIEWIHKKFNYSKSELDSKNQLKIKVGDLYQFFDHVRISSEQDQMSWGRPAGDLIGLPSIFDGLPHFYKYINSLNQQQVQELTRYLLMAGRSSPTESELLDYFDIRNVMVVLYYVESTMMSFDADRDGLLNQQEVLKAEPRFRSFVRKASQKDKMLEEIFLYLVYFGKKPDTQMSWENIKAFLRIQFSDLGSVDRLQLVKVLGALKQETQ